MLKHFLWVGALSLSLISSAFAAGSFAKTKSGSSGIEYEISPNPPIKGEADFWYDILDSSGKAVGAVSKYSTDIEMEMDSHKHRSRPVKTIETNAGARRFHATGMYFLMDGTWKILIDFELADGTKDSAAIPIEVLKK